VSLVLPLSVRADNDAPTDPLGADFIVGERLFLETRFSQYFFTNCNGDANAIIPGDPSVETLKTTTGDVRGPFAGLAMNCRQCHLVDEKGYGDFGDHTLGNRTYADFTRRSRVPPRGDGLVRTTRNAPTLVDAFIPRDTPLFLHHDGQFASAHDLIIGTLTGRNFGWKPEEYATAVHHIANIIRNDDATGYLATQARGGRFQIEDGSLATYSNIFAGFTDYNGNYIWDVRALIPDLIAPQYQLDMRYATDDQILDTAASLIESYMRNLFFSQDTNGLDFVGDGTPVFNGSPFDIFLIKNNLPRYPNTNETALQYSVRLRQSLDQLANPQFVTDPADGHFDTHVQTFQFGATELAGLKIFLADKSSFAANPKANVGNCAACHSLPAFTDFIFHNTGAAQQDYEAVHGAGSFNHLKIPDLATRQSNYDAWLPPTPLHPHANGLLETPPDPNIPGAADLGLWNVYANPDFPAPQPGLAQIVPRLLGLSSPQIETATITGNQFILDGSNGPSNAPYFVMISTGAGLSSNNWSVVATGHFDSTGRFHIVVPAPASASVFYRLALPLPSASDILAQTIGLFKTPNLRDLGHSAPYLHTGRMDTLEEVIVFYQNKSREARLGTLRNADPRLLDIHLNNSATAPLAAFLRSLNEDYTD
jgi:hypothetical protein